MFFKEGLNGMIELVNSFVEMHQLVSENSPIVIGVSGGPDSLALLHYMNEMSKEKQLTIVVAHVDHMFRGKQSEDDLRFVEQFCRNLGIRCESVQIDVTSYQVKNRMSAQVAARECRYRFYEQIMRKYNAESLALGHHGDDQIETILMKLTRGSSALGYAGIQVKRPFTNGQLIRPFLCVTKDMITQYCEKHRLEPRYDPSNEKRDYTRNRYRHSMLPFLKQENQQVHMHFQQFSEKLTQDEMLLMELTEEKMNKVMKRNKDHTIQLDVELFEVMPISLQRRGIQLILKYLYKDSNPDLSSIHIESLLSLLEKDQPSGTLHFPQGLRITRSYHTCTFSFFQKEAEPYCMKIEENSSINLENGYELVSKSWGEYPQNLLGNERFIIDSEEVTLPLYVRSRKNGDKMSLKGMNGTKKVKDIFIDEKVPRESRDIWPIVTDSEGVIIWIPLLKKSPFEADNKSKSKYITLTYSKQRIL